MSSLPTEQLNPRTADIDTVPTAELLRRINEEDATVAAAVARALPAIERVVERVVAAFTAGGRLIYVGAGTSGRLAVLDAAECPPTYGTDPRQVQAVIAGGPAAMTTSLEGAEDDAAQGARDVEVLDVGPHDVVLGIAASGATPYVAGALRQAAAGGACAAALVGAAGGAVSAAAELLILVETGPEVVAGSTRMKAGTAQKMVLTMISTAAMVRTGHTYGNLMVDMQARNSKLRQRAVRMVSHAAAVDQETAEGALAAGGGEVKTAVVMLGAGVDAAEARARLARAGGTVRLALQEDGR